MPPRSLGPYTVVDLLGRGGMGSVFRCRTPAGQEVAVKTLSLEDRSPERAARRFRREVGALVRLSHPNLVRVLDVGEDAGVPYLVMGLVPGRSLQERLDTGGPLEEHVAARMFQRLAAALSYAHGCGVLHRDLKPPNVIVRPDGEPVLVDFGLVKDELLETSRLTRTGAHLGTPGYWPLEQMQGRHDEVDARSDVYGLGATLYAALTGRPPYLASSWAELVQQIKHPVDPPSAHRRGLDPRLERIVLRCLEREPGRRYPSADAVARDLAVFLRGPASAGPTRRGLLLSAALAAAGGSGLLAAVVWRTRGSPAPEPGPPPPPPPSPDVLPPLPPLEDLERDRAQLLAGVEHLPAPPTGSIPGPVVCLSPRSVVLVSAQASNLPFRSTRHQALAVAARFGAGRVVVVGHDDFTKPRAWNRDTPEGGARWIVAQLFLTNCLSWTGGRRERLRIGLLAPQPGGLLTNVLRDAGHVVQDLTRGPRLEELDLILWRESPEEGALDPAAVRAFVEAGGGLLLLGCPWGKQQLAGPDVDWRDASLENQVLGPMGLALNRAGYLRAPASGRWELDPARCAEAHTLRTLHAEWSGALDAEPEVRREALIQLAWGVAGLPSRGVPLLGWLVDALRDELGELPAPSPEAPAELGTRRALGVAVFGRVWAGLEGGEVPHGASFPGAVPADAPRVRRRVEVPPEALGWISTGLYAPPGATLRARVTAGSAGGLALRIGAHTEALWGRERWARYPEVSRRWALGAAETAVASPFGGLVYLERLGSGGGEVELEGAVEAPSWSPATGRLWREARAAPGAWGELSGARVILTVPAARLRELDDPGALLAFWDEVVARGARFVGAEPPGPLRLVADVEHAPDASPLAGGAAVADLELLLAPRGLRGDSAVFDTLARGLAHPAWDVKALRRGQRWLLSSVLCRVAGGSADGAPSTADVRLLGELAQTLGVDAMSQAFARCAALPESAWGRGDATRLGLFYEALCDAGEADLEARFRAAKIVPPAAALARVKQKHYPAR